MVDAQYHNPLTVFRSGIDPRLLTYTFYKGSKHEGFQRAEQLQHSGRSAHSLATSRMYARSKKFLGFTIDMSISLRTRFHLQTSCKVLQGEAQRYDDAPDPVKDDLKEGKEPIQVLAHPRHIVHGVLECVWCLGERLWKVVIQRMETQQ